VARAKPRCPLAISWLNRIAMVLPRDGSAADARGQQQRGEPPPSAASGPPADSTRRPEAKRIVGRRRAKCSCRPVAKPGGAAAKSDPAGDWAAPKARGRMRFPDRESEASSSAGATRIASGGDPRNVREESSDRLRFKHGIHWSSGPVPMPPEPGEGRRIYARVVPGPPTPPYLTRFDQRQGSTVGEVGAAELVKTPAEGNPFLEARGIGG